MDLERKEKVQVERDLAIQPALEFVRYYSSAAGSVKSMEALAPGWRHNFSKRLFGTFAKSTPRYTPPNLYWSTSEGWVPKIALHPTSTMVYFYAMRPDGYSWYFTSANGGMHWETDTDVNYRLLTTAVDSNGNPSQFHLLTPQDDIEVYDQLGRLIEIRFRSGYVQTLTYSDAATLPSIAPNSDLLIQVSDSFGRSLRFEYNESGQMTKLIGPAGETYLYSHDAKNNLAAIVYPDGLRRTYHYNEAANQPSSVSHASRLLTGVSEEVRPESLVRYATYKYNANGYPISTEHTGGVNKYSFDYANATVTDPSGTKRQLALVMSNGIARVQNVSQAAGAGSVAANDTKAYDANSNISSYTDFNGNVTRYTYDLSRNLETKRIEGFGKPEARTISTQWHPTYRLPVKIAEPQRLTTNTYDDHGNLLQKTVQATTDVNGTQGFAATVTGTVRSWSYTYNAVGQVLTTTDPLGAVTTNTYDSQGNLITVTNAAGHVTTLSDYDLNGRVGKITDPNGLVTTLTYSPRGWLTSRTVGGDTTRYDYDGVGQLKKVTLPDATAIDYTHDDAHRLTGMSDSAGNRIVYTLDAMGNRIKEEVIDPDGILTGKVTRVYDALNRLQQLTGGVQ